ncbi:IgGFc-binding protein [Nannocystaceae bacterium ST9]
MSTSTRLAALAILAAALPLACNDDTTNASDGGTSIGGSDEIGDTTTTNGESSSTNGESTSTDADSSSTDADSSSTDADSSSTDADSSSTDADSESTTEAKLDMMMDPDMMGPPGPVIPETCDQALQGNSTVGCLFYGVDLDSHDAAENQQFAIAVSNVQQGQVANVVIERKQGNVWNPVAGPAMVNPLSLQTFNLAAFNQDDSGIKAGGAYRVTSDVPIIAYQFNPVDGSTSYLSDASMLYPVPTWDRFNQVVGWRVIDDGFGVQGAYVTIVAAVDGTQVTVTPSTSTLAGPGVPAGQANVPFMIMLNEGDIAEVMTKGLGQGLTGTRIETPDVDHPVAVFSGNECTFIPANVYACDHLEEQISGVRLWGMHFIASRVPPRSNTPDTSLWQIYASEDGTQVTLSANPAVTGLPNNNFMLNAGQVMEFYAGGTAAHPGDFEVEASKPIAVLNYMTGAENPGAAGTGDPAMVQLSPVEQFLPRYVVLVPGTWNNDVAVLAREAGNEVLLDGVPVANNLFIPVANSGYEVARVPVSDGVHVFDGGDNAFSVVILGYDSYDSYAYLGGTGTGIINPDPQ